MERRPQGGQGQNRTGESPPSGIAGGPAETWTMVALGPHLAYRKSECWQLSAYSCARRRSIPTAKGTLVPFHVTQYSFCIYAAFWIKKSSWSAKPWSRIPQATAGTCRVVKCTRTQ